MTDFFAWFMSPGNAIAIAQLFAAAITAVATFALWRVTRVLAIETASLAKMTSQAFVICSLESSAASAIAMNATLRNTGNATAFDIRGVLLPGLPNPDGTKLDDNPTTFEISLLAPGQALPLSGFRSFDIPNAVFQVKLSWSQAPGRHEREHLEYRIEPKDGFRGGWRSKGTHEVAEELEKITKLLRNTQNPGVTNS